MSVCLLCVYATTPWSPEEGLWSPGDGVTADGELPRSDAGNWIPFSARASNISSNLHILLERLSIPHNKILEDKI